MSNRPSIPAEVSRQVLIESGHRCAVCGDSCPLERAHIIPFCDSQDHALENLICLCANCHGRADKEHWGERTLREYKRRPWVNRKYTDRAAAQPNMTRLEIRIDLEYEHCDQRSRSHLQHALAGFLGIPPEYVKLKSVSEGSVRIIVMLPEVEAEQLIHAYEMKDPTLSEHLTPFNLLGIHRDMQSRERLLTDKVFRKLIAKRGRKLLGLAKQLSQCQSSNDIMTRPFMGELLSQSTQLEELLDAYDAGGNCQWCALRSLTAAIKHFSDASYELLHIRHSLPTYRLLPIRQDFVKATEETLSFTACVLRRAANQMLIKADQLGLSVPSESLREESYTEELPPGRLPHLCKTRRIETVAETVTLLTTAFLNLTVESEDVRAASRAKPEEYASYVLDSVSEEKLRSLELRFHNLQSLYDTYVSGTEAAELDPDLPVLRGHISVVFHLLRTATLFVHHYERHVNKQPCDSPARQEPLVKAETLLAILMNYSITHIGLYINCAEHLCHEMLKRYSEVGRIEVNVPPYRGFHVRPCTLISKLVRHYGSEVRMELDEEVYNAGSPLELFRANEKINARKRRWLASEIDRLKLVRESAGQNGIDSIVRAVVLTLAEHSKLIMYEQPLQLPEEPARKEGTLLEKVTDEMARLLALGKIDIEADLTAIFTGDKRVLADIKLLAESGYGEDNFGNNIPLPEKLEYLRR